MEKTPDTYVKNIAEIRLLSSPRLSDVKTANNYRTLLLENFVKIGELAKIDRDILDEQVYPFLKAGQKLPKEKVKEFENVVDEMLDLGELENLDPNILLMLLDKLLEDAIENRDDDTVVRFLDYEIMACYTMLNAVRRISTRPDLAEEYRIRGIDTSDRLFIYLDKDLFSKLSDDSKTTILINTRYFCVFYEGTKGTEAENEKLLSSLKRSLDLCEDPYFREALPDYDWDYHKLRTMEYMGMLLENNNHRGMNKQQCQYIAELMDEMTAIWQKDKDRYVDMISEGELKLNRIRAKYKAGLMIKEEYMEGLLELYESRNRNEFEIRDSFQHLTVPLEYMLLLRDRSINEPQIRQLADFYSNTISFLHLLQDTGSLSFPLEYASAILEHFIEIPGGITFEDMCISCMAAIHPPTYVHTMMVGELARCICRHMLYYRPDAFDKMRAGMHCSDDEILDFTWHAATCHDFGKLPIIDTIMVYGRSILDDEYALIKTHPDMGYSIMNRYPSTRKYARVARGHHKWYDNSKGYPENFFTTDLPEKVICDIVTVADCLDASTDTVGRSYSRGKTFEELRDELSQGSGRRYSPDVVELFYIPEVVKDLKFLLANGRNENYLETYILLNSVREKEKVEEELL